MRIKEIIDARNRMSKQANEARTSWCKKYLSADARQNYMEKYISEKLSAELAEITETEYSANVRFNKELIAESEALLEAAKRKIVPAFERPDDYAMQIANALTMLKMLPLSEDNVELIFSPFKADYEQMRVFDHIVSTLDRHVCEIEHRQPYDYEKTFAETRKRAEKLAYYDELREIAERLFLYPKTERDVIRAGADVYVKEYADGYDEITGQARMLELAESEVA